MTRFILIATIVFILIEATAFPAVLAASNAIAAASQNCDTNYVVTTTADSGPGSLREAITSANASCADGPFLISFNIPGAGVQTISPASILPLIMRPVTVDGYSQPGASVNTLAEGENAVLLVVLNGRNAGFSWGLALASSNITVRGLVINEFTHDAIFVDGPDGASDCIIEGNFIGVDAAGSLAMPNGWPAQGAVEVSASPRNRIGGTTPAARNLISGNAYAGIAVQGPASTGSVIQGNWVGLSASGTAAIPNGDDGVFVEGSGNLIGGTVPGARNVFAGGPGGLAIASGSHVIQGNYFGVGPDGLTVPGTPGVGLSVFSDNNLVGGDVPGAGNVISGHSVSGLQLIGSTNVVQGNFIGTDATGTQARGNGIRGVLVISAGNLIGGLSAGARNVISGNGVGVEVQDAEASGNTIQGNFIGTDPTGTNALPNLSTGISLEGSSANLIGGTTPATRNVISGNGGFGVGIAFAGASNNLLQGNLIGVAADGATPLPNYAGVRLVNGPHDNLIGGTLTGAGNVIAHNLHYAVSALGPGVTNNAILGNSIFAHPLPGIDLGEDGVTANDLGDTDEGPNRLQNSPELMQARIGDGGALQLRYRVDSTVAAAAFPLTVEFFLADAGGSGEKFLHRTTYSTPQAASEVVWAPLVLPAVGDRLVATATDANGNTSEFSAITTFTKSAPVEELAFEMWQYSYGGGDEEWISEFTTTPDGGFLIAGTSYSGADGNKTADNLGTGDWNGDWWIVRTDAQGQILWDKAYGGPGDEGINDLRPISPTRWVVSGFSASEPGPGKTSPSYGDYDSWWITIDAAGTKLAEASAGGAGFEGTGFFPTPDGGGFLAGFSSSGISGTKTITNYGDADGWLVRYGSDGNSIWQAGAGGDNRDNLSVCLTLPDGGVLQVGRSRSGISGNKTAPNYGDDDGWVVRFDSNGNKLWDRTYGGTAYDAFYGATAMPDGTFVLVGETYSGVSGNKISPNHGGNDAWVVRIDGDGNVLWDLTFGGTGYDYASRVAAMPDGGVLVTADSASEASGNKEEPHIGPLCDPPCGDVWLIRLDASGNKMWERVLGGDGDESSGATLILPDGFITGHSSPSAPSGNKTSPNYGNNDYWVLRFATRLGPVGMPALFVNGTYTATNALTLSNTATIELRTSFTNGTIFYTLDGSDPALAPQVYTGPFSISNSIVLRVFASSADSIASAELPAVTLTVAVPPSLLAQPQNQTVVEGESAAFAVDAVGTAPLTYQWLGDSGPLPGQTNAVLEFQHVGAGQAGGYRVSVTNAFGAVTSAPAVLQVLAPPQVTLAPFDTNVVIGGSVTLSVSAVGTPPLSFQWRKNGVTLPGATSSNLVFNSVQVSDGGSYTVLIVNQGGSVIVGPVRLTIVVPVVQPNDDFANRVTLTGLSGLVAGTNTGATKEIGEPNHGGQPGGRSVWYRWVAPTNGIARFRTTGSAFDTLLGVYTGSAVNNLHAEAEDEDLGGFLTSAVTFNVTNGVDYALAIDGFAAASGSFFLAWDTEPSTNPAPEIVVPPSDRTVLAGATTNFTVTARGESLTYQWLFNGAPIADATNAALEISNVQDGQVGFYAVKVTSGGHEVISPPALLEIGLDPTLHSRGKIDDLVGGGGGPVAPAARGHSIQPAAFLSPVLGQISYNVIVSETNVSQCRITCSGYRIVGTRWLTGLAFSPNGSTTPTVIFSVTNNTGSKVLSVCRQIASIGPWVDLGCSTGAMRIVNDDDYEYLLGVQSIDDGVVSTNNRIDWVFGLAPTITLSAPREVPAGTNLTLVATINNHVAASLAGTTNHIPDATLQWYFNGQPIPGQTSSNLVLANVQPAQAGAYALVAANVIGSTTNQFNLAVGAPPAFLSASRTRYVTAGSSLSLFAEAAPNTTIGGISNPPPSYQWYYLPPTLDRTNLLVRQTNAVLNNPLVLLSTAGVYRVVANNRFGSSAHEDLVVVGTPPGIVMGSSTQYVAVGGNVTLDAIVTNGPAAGWPDAPPPPALQWFGNAVALDGATTIPWTIQDLHLNQEGIYRLQAANAFGTATGLTFVCVGQPPRLLSQTPAAGRWVAERGTALDLSVVVEGSVCGLSYQWSQNGRRVGTASTLGLRSIQGTNAGVYLALVTNAFGAVTSAPVQLVVAQNVQFKPVAPAPGSTNFCLTWNLSPGANSLQYLDSLADTNWVTLWSTNVAQPSAATFCEPTLSNTQRFYRIVIGE